MFGIQYFRGAPTDYVLAYKGGRLAREGAGLSFYYFAPTTTLVRVPVGSRDEPFAFKEVTADFQAVTVQGQLTWRVLDARRLAGLLDFTLTRAGRYASDDPQKVGERLVHAAQALARAFLGKLPLRAALASAEALSTELARGLRSSESVELLGLELLSASVLSLEPTPEAARALEADAREALLREADEALYARRNAAIEQERTLRENELATELAVAARQRQLREARLAADIAAEEQRKALLALQLENDRAQADARGYALEAALVPLRGTDWRTLLALAAANGADPRVLTSLAFRELAENASKIGQLTITPELLAGLTQGPSPR